MDVETTRPTESEQWIVDEHIVVDCNLIAIDEHTWAIHGSIAVGGDVLVAEFSSPDEAQAALERIAAAQARSIGS